MALAMNKRRLPPLLLATPNFCFHLNRPRGSANEFCNMR